MDKELLHKFILDRCSPDEIDGFFDQLKNHPKEDPGEIVRGLWDGIDLSENPDKEYAIRQLDKIHHMINLDGQGQDAKKVRLPQKGRARFIDFATRAAAILFIPVLAMLVSIWFFQPELYAFFYASPDYEIVSPASSRIQFQLPDGTKVWLNQGSKMVYPHKFRGNDRAVELVGEAFFDVVPDKTKPFIVKTSKMAVKALGTSFNVKAYADDLKVEATLVSGKVVLLNLADGEHTEICKMKPGEQFVLNKETYKYSLETVSPDKYICWREGGVIFQDDRLDDVARLLSRHYNVKVILADPSLKHLTYTATFVDEELNMVLEMMEYIMPISYEINREKLPDGTFSDKKIIIYKKGGKLDKNQY